MVRFLELQTSQIFGEQHFDRRPRACSIRPISTLCQRLDHPTTAANRQQPVAFIPPRPDPTATMMRLSSSRALRAGLSKASRQAPTNTPVIARAAASTVAPSSNHAISNPTLANIEKRWEGMPLPEQAELWMALRDRMKENWTDMTLQEKKAGESNAPPQPELPNSSARPCSLVNTGCRRPGSLNRCIQPVVELQLRTPRPPGAQGPRSRGMKAAS